MAKLNYDKKPTIDMYESAKQANDVLHTCINMANREIMKLLDRIIEEKKKIEVYEECIANNSKIIVAYEMFEEKEK